jgi:Tol biopolymer transport system component
MTLSAGSRLGPYEIVSPLGAGGMGEVYKAHDTRLDRTVAIKVLSSRLTATPEVRQRFEREAKTISQLSHPHICAIHDVGREGETEYLVMEYLEGETLAERLARGSLPLEQTLRFGIQIADALDKAHRQGIVHRDLKPGNVMITKSAVKLLDFGLAKTFERSLDATGREQTAGAQHPMAGRSPTALPTQAANLTQEGAILGTFQYMAPEQVEGRGMDARTDIFALGVVLYEMATGRKAFSGATQASMISSILRDQPSPISQVTPASPPLLDRVVQTCLAKDPDDRWQSAADVKRELQWIAEEPRGTSSPAVAPAVAVRPRNRERLGWLLLALVLAALAGYGLVRRRGPAAAPPRAVRFAVPIPPGATFSPAEISRGASISPDGTRVAIEAFARGKRRLFVRRLDSEEAVELEGSDDATSHFWSPDGRFIAFFANGKLKKIPATGGPAEDLCDASFEIVGTWNREGTILFKQFARGIYRVSDKGGKPEPIRPGDVAKPETIASWPQFLPDGRRFLYLGRLSLPKLPGSHRELRVGSLDSKEDTVIARMESRAEFAAPGYLVYARDGALFAQRFDESKAQLKGDPQRLSESVNYFFGPGNAAFSVGADVIVYETSPPLSRLAWLDRQGREVGTLGQPAVVEGFRISPDGGRVAVDVAERRTGTSDVWVFELERGISTRLHSDARDENLPVWTPDGSKLLFRSDAKGPPDIHEIAVGVPGSERPVLELEYVQQPEDVSPDGRVLAFLNNVQSRATIWLLPLAGQRKPAPWLATRFNERNPRFSPDGRWIAYESDESGSPEIYVALTEGAAGKRRVSPAGGRRPRWRRDGRELYYLAPDGSVMAVPLSPGPQLQAGAPVSLFRVEPPIQNYDVTADGSRFLVSAPLEAPESPIRAIVGWPALAEKER